jgi:heme-degrading monooxygenase HmoA
MREVTSVHYLDVSDTRNYDREGTMIARTWTGAVRRADAEEYAAYIRDTGFSEYARTPGNRGAWMLRRDDGERTEFITLSLWESEAAIRAFAGDDIEAAVLYPEDERYLVGESTVAHYRVVDEVRPGDE